MIKQKSFFLVHILFGIVFLGLGILAFFAQMGMEYFIPANVFTAIFLEVMILLVGIFFIREAVRNKDSQERFVHLVVGLSLFFFAVIPLLVSLGIIKFLPYYIDLNISSYILSLLLLFAGAFMIIDRIFLVVSE